MSPINILINKQMDGYSFSISPSTRTYIKMLFPDAHPANNIFVAYDIQSDFETQIGQLENYIYPALLGVKSEYDLELLNEIFFIEAQSGKVLHKLILRDEKV